MRITKALTLCPLAMAALAFSLIGDAAGFDCAKAASVTEKAICESTVLSKLDSDLSETWKLALATNGDTRDLKASQRKWLAQRNACGADTTCLIRRYHERQTALKYQGVAQGDQWQQSWSKDIISSTSGSELIFTGTAPHLHFTISANSGGNSGVLEGDIVLRGNHATFHQDGCQLDFTRQDGRIRIAQQGDDADCGAGMGVYYDGSYIPTRHPQSRPAIDLVTLMVLSDGLQDVAARALLGKDYQLLVDTINQGVDGEDKDALGATVREYWVRGLASTNAAIVMRKEEQLWIGLLIFEQNDQVHMRYYTNASPWKKDLPKTIRDWHDESNLGAYKTIPIDLMH